MIPRLPGEMLRLMRPKRLKVGSGRTQPAGLSSPRVGVRCRNVRTKLTKLTKSGLDSA